MSSENGRNREKERENLNNQARTSISEYTDERNGMKNNWSFGMDGKRLLERVRETR